MVPSLSDICGTMVIGAFVVWFALTFFVLLVADKEQYIRRDNDEDRI